MDAKFQVHPHQPGKRRMSLRRALIAYQNLAVAGRGPSAQRAEMAKALSPGGLSLVKTAPHDGTPR